MEMARVMTVAGSDSGGGAGIQADIKTITVLGGYASSAISALTAQNTFGVRAVHAVPPEFLSAQIDAIMEDIGADAAKSGMLHSAEVIETVADSFVRHKVCNYVLDPVLVAKSGALLLEPDAIDVLAKKLFPLARLVTPNIPEAERVGSIKINDTDSMREAAKRIRDLGPAAVLVKGGHLKASNCVDILLDGADFYEFSGSRIDSRNTHGTGCTLSAAIATCLGFGLGLEAAVGRAREFVFLGIQHAPGIGGGWGPLNHLAAAGHAGASFD